MKTRTKKELKEAYNISGPTLSRWLDAIPEIENQKKKRVFSPLEVNFIFEKYGNPFTRDFIYIKGQNKNVSED